MTSYVARVNQVLNNKFTIEQLTQYYLLSVGCKSTRPRNS